MTQNVNVYQTRALQDWCEEDEDYGKWEAAERAKEYLEGATSDSSNGDLNVNIVKDHSPDPVSEGSASEAFSGIAMCGGATDYKSYDSLWDWWNDWLHADCFNKDRADHGDLLLTAYKGGGGLAMNKACVACSGKGIVECDENYNKFGYEPRHNYMDTVLEEVGHILQGQGSCPDNNNQDDDRSNHDTGVVKYESAEDRYGVTPIGITADRCHNDCKGSDKDSDYCFDKCDTDNDTDPEGWCLHYSECTICAFPS